MAPWELGFHRPEQSDVERLELLSGIAESLAHEALVALAVAAAQLRIGEELD